MSESSTIIPPATTTTNTATNNNNNKDLSCLRCRKKKAKCSKTRPTCTRCARSNQPCEYPDAPPNLTDLSRQVLSLYDALCALENQFLHQYTENHKYLDGGGEEKEEGLPTIEKLSLEHKRPKTTVDPTLDDGVGGGGPPGTWSIFLTSDGLSLHAVTRNMVEFATFAKNFSHQLCDNDDDWYDEEEDDTELDEDDYLVTIPVFPISSLIEQPPSHGLLLLDMPKDEQVIRQRLRAGFRDIVSVVRRGFVEDLSSSRFPVVAQQLLSFLQQQLLMINPDLASFDSLTPVQQMALCTSYSVFTSTSHHSSTLNEDCIQLARVLLFDQLSSTQLADHALLTCAVLLSSVVAKPQKLIHFCIRALFAAAAHDCSECPKLAASLLILDAWSTTTTTTSVGEEAEAWLLRAAGRVGDDVAVLRVEAELAHFLKRVIALFYSHHHDRRKNVRKVDVDDVLTLVKDMEQWEYRLPAWLKWQPQPQQQEEDDCSLLKTHVHLLHNMIKILLFRPFCCLEDSSDDNMHTYTRTTFLDMSLEAAGRLTECLRRAKNDAWWIRTGQKLALDVIDRVEKVFSCDTELMAETAKIRQQLSSSSCLSSSSNNNHNKPDELT